MEKAMMRLAEQAMFLSGHRCGTCGIPEADTAFGHTPDGRSCYAEYLAPDAAWKDAATGATIEDTVEHDGFPPVDDNGIGVYWLGDVRFVVRCCRHRPRAGRRCL